ncbi:MAG: sugar phosphate isomerase/epimerase, partial [Deltaproteobacteria bacterium]|nr:sugar phosphate isomerase/epimerase [Deltaproteobacteria bacterium]
RYGFIREAWIERSLELWSWLAAAVREEGAILVLENVYEQGPGEMEVLFRNLEQWGVGFCLDTGHQAVYGSVPVARWVESLAPYLFQLHLHDNTGAADDHLALGRGSIDFRALMGDLKRKMPSPPLITLEPHREEDLWPSIEYLEQIWPW